jgi:two-component system OmpR family sensor kinase
MSETLNKVLLVEGLATLLVVVALSLVAWWVLHLGVRPLDRMAQTADAIAAGDLSRRVDRAEPNTEVGRLGLALNKMLGEIEQAVGDSRASEDRLRRFIADASHELRTPLTSIRGYAELWRQGGLDSDAALADAMRRTEQEAARMGVLVDDMLLLARLDQGRPLESAPVDLAILADDAVADTRAVEPSRPVTIESPGQVVVLGDEGRLRQVISNLLTNTRVHTPSGTPVRVRVGVEGGRAILEVEDDGPGFGSEPDRVFERFYRADPARARASGGIGLGLSIVASVVEAHGGTTTAGTTPSGGARIRIELPLSSPPAESQTGPEPRSEQFA